MRIDDSTVEFMVPCGEYIRYREGQNCVLEELFTEGKWIQAGLAHRLYYNEATYELKDQDHRGGLLPPEDAASIVRKIAQICDNCGLEFTILNGNQKGSPRSGAGRGSSARAEFFRELEVTFTAPSGDGIKYVPSSKGLYEYIYNRKQQKWEKVGIATSLHYNTHKRALVDQDNAGGVLPAAGLTSLLRALRIACEAADVLHDIPMPTEVKGEAPYRQPTKASGGRSRSRRGYSSESFDSLSDDEPGTEPGRRSSKHGNRGRGRLDFWGNFVEEICRVKSPKGVASRQDLL
ncbi:hypothetical protein DIPPA_10915 [Diplonema papillatum]|nr:hypothetical protein DIPPA_10915 [Diplonema papillatum]|eukprot:gene21438-32979_t